MMVLARIAAGGVVGSPWAHLGVPVAGIGAVTFGGLGAVSLTIAAVAGWGTVQWVDRPAVEAAATAAATAGVSPSADPENPSPVAEIAGSGADSGELETSSQDDSVETADPPEDAADRHH
jgi:hypothetical protein